MEKMLHLTLDEDYTHVHAYAQMINPGAEDRVGFRSAI